jgi:hypothetical protein
MARYDTYLAGDDRVLEDLDSGFVGLNNRLRPDQLKPGILADSQNGRMELNGQWSTRKGISNKLAPLVSGASALTLPFFNIGTSLGDTDGITAAHGACGTSVIDSVRRLQVTLEVDGQTSTDFAVTGATEPDSVADFTNTLSTLSLSFTNGIHSCRVASIATATISNTSSASRDGSTTTVKVQYDGVNLTSTHGLTSGANVTIANASYSGTGGAAAVNTTHTITAISTTGSTSNDTLSFVVQGLDDAVSGTGVTATFNNTITLTITDYVCGNDTFSSGSVVVKNPALADTAVNEVYGSCIFSDPNASSESYIILAANTKAVAVKISDPNTTFDLGYTGSETVSSPVEMIQAFNKVYIFREGDAALFVDLSTNNITGSPTMQLVDEGDFTQPVTLTATVCDIDNNECTITSNTHGLKVGDVIICTKQGDSTLIFDAFSVISGFFTNIARPPTTYTITSVPSTTQFKFNVGNSVADIADGSISTYPQFISEVSSSLGYIHMPAPKYGVVHQRRLAVPYRFDTSGSTTVTDRKIFDEVILSKILDTDTYDKRFGQFRFNAGMADFNVGMLSFSDDKLIVFNRNSIHQVTGEGKVETLSNQLLTDEVGLIARNTISQIGNQILFLSDNGVYGLTFVDRYNLRGTELPLSESIQETINRINKAAAEKSVAVYFDNRYYIAVPTDGSPVNNTLLIYNFLNKSWESIDSVDNSNLTGSDFEFTNLLVTGSGLDKGVYVVNTDGGIHKLETEADGIDRVITQIGSTTEEESRIKGSATTRMFTLNSIDRKKWNNFELHLESSPDNSSDVSITGIAENPDSEPDIDLLTASDYLGEDIPAGEDVSIRARIGNNRAYGFQMKIDSTLGLPSFRAIKVAGVETFRSTSSVQ